mgnify:CR=1 FL=1
MKRNSTMLMSGVAAATLFAIAFPAVAQEGPADEEKKLGIITVTAEKRTESSQDVGQSIQAFDAEGLERAGVEDVSRLDQIVSGVNYAFVGNDAKFNVRGANSTNTFGDNSSIVGTFVDGVYMTRASQQSRAFFDVERLEFLKGPQGTLYGRNTFAGALNLYTNAPDLDGYGAGIDLSYERFNKRRFEGFANVPVTDTFALRLAAFTENGDGYIENRAGPDQGAPNDQGIRLSALWEANADLDILARISNVTERGREVGVFGNTFLCRNVTPQGLTDPFGSEQDCANPNPGSAGLPDANSLDPWEVSQDFVPEGDLEQNNFSLEINWDAGPVLVKSTTGYVDFDNLLGMDAEFSPNPHSRFWFDEQAETFSQEIQLSSDYDSPLQWTTGLYYSQEETFFSFSIFDHTEAIANRGTVTGPNGDTFTLLTGTPLASRDTLIGGFFADSGFRDIEYFGVYGQAEYSLSDRFRLIAGLRFNDETKDLSGAGSNFTGDTDGDGIAEAPVTVRAAFQDGAAGLPVIPTNPNTVFAINESADDATTGSASFDNINWRAGAEFDVTPDIMLYASAATGFLSGAIGNSGTITDEQESQVIEGGLKGQFLDGRLLFNGAIHYTEYTNLLTQIQIPQGDIVVTESRNGGEIEAAGVEAELVYVPTDALRLSANFAFLDSEFAEFGETNPYQLFDGEVRSFIDVSGTTTPWSPDFTANLSGDYTIDLADYGTLTPGISFYYSDEYFTSNLFSADPNQIQDAYTKTDLRLVWDSPDRDYSVTAFVENLEDEAVLARGNNNGSDTVQTSFLYPRNYGIRLSARF